MVGIDWQEDKEGLWIICSNCVFRRLESLFICVSMIIKDITNTTNSVIWIRERTFLFLKYVASAEKMQRGLLKKMSVPKKMMVSGFLNGGST